jgi:hypothetical protein
MQLTQAQFARAKQLYAERPALQKMTAETVSERLGASLSSIHGWRRELGLAKKRKPPGSIDKKRPQFTRRQVDGFRTLQLWKRPKGIDEHLEMLRD